MRWHNSVSDATAASKRRAGDRATAICYAVMLTAKGMLASDAVELDDVVAKAVDLQAVVEEHFDRPFGLPGRGFAAARLLLPQVRAQRLELRRRIWEHPSAALGPGPCRGCLPAACPAATMPSSRCFGGARVAIHPPIVLGRAEVLRARARGPPRAKLQSRPRTAPRRRHTRRSSRRGWVGGRGGGWPAWPARRCNGLR